MGVSYMSVSTVCTVLSFVGLQCWIGWSLDKVSSDGLIVESIINPLNASQALEAILDSYTTIALVANFVINTFVLLILCLKTIFFGELHSSETRKLAERLINYIIYKGTFLPLVVPPTIFQAGLWSTWLVVLCSLKMFQALARDRLDRLNASPTATPWNYFRVYSMLLLVLSLDLFWIKLCLTIYSTISSPIYLLLFFEPLSIAFETLQAILVHGFQLLDIWLHHSSGDIANSRMSKLFDVSAAGSFLEWKCVLIRNVGFFLDMMTLLMALAHYVHIWWLHGMAFHLMDAVLFLNIRALLSAIVKRVKGFIKLRIALGTLHGALPDATSEELQAYDDECAICREPMAKAKKLSCNHLFHLACLRSWLDQGLAENYSCPTCRKPLFVGRPENEVNTRAAEVSGDEQLARQMSMVLDRSNLPGHPLPTEVFRNQTQNPLENRDWRGAGVDSSWLGFDGAGPSTGVVRSGSLGRVQMMMRHLAAVGETYAQTALEDAAWSLLAMHPSQAAGTSSSPTPPANPTRSPENAAGLRLRTPHAAAAAANDNIAHIMAMAETVREVLPHIPDEIIFQDLQRTNSPTVTVNNLLQM
ncbi:PREDICTED: E3 ubiquitin protein ligase RIN2 [Ipomoea nil]|uniref:E3 ubiquitin protein ligase RIN2 n=1 Tax=Ipomoea nil TaxID=35883 RepID=UPI0009010816|nr:PREDICTED: E3 ubiquitin protein ligase RIN2 [Ipomoea nil]XP_019200464.1 PREDICTED: E3 ubiquitin protein ligase RIN2 [Ipomoea nil]XP_019200465.1 PREDICTED: E3 ubiquitin protein ligase RIN2 [Ipomoea nil]